MVERSERRKMEGSRENRVKCRREQGAWTPPYRASKVCHFNMENFHEILRQLCESGIAKRQYENRSILYVVVVSLIS